MDYREETDNAIALLSKHPCLMGEKMVLFLYSIEVYKVG
jgi:hypothetical protein